MARTVASLWPLRFDVSRSQSCLRIATTAAPVSAADLEREWLESATDPDEGTIHVRTLRRRPSFSGADQYPDRHTMPSVRGAAPLFASVLSGFRRSPSASKSPLLEGGSQRGSSQRKTSFDLKDLSARGGKHAGAVLPPLHIQDVSVKGGTARLNVSPGSSLRGGMLGLPSPAVHAGGSLRGGNAVAGLALWQGGSRRGSTGGLSVLDVLREGASETALGKEERSPRSDRDKELAGAEGQRVRNGRSDALRANYEDGGATSDDARDDGERGPGRRRKGKPVLDS